MEKMRCLGIATPGAQRERSESAARRIEEFE
jgi:hypothetical protein